MKTQLSKLLIFSLFVIALGSCKKDAEMPNEFVNLKTSEATEITAISAVVSAKAGADCTERGVCWGKAPNPTLDDFHIANGSGKGEYSCTLTDLEPNQKYYYRAYATDGTKLAYATDEKSFTTRDGLATLTTSAATCLGSTYATLGGVVTDDHGMPILERGVCYGLEPGTSLDGLSMTSTDSTSTFAVALTGLENETMYYYKAYVKPLLGSVVYGEELTFTTLDGRPVVSTGNITEITATSATCSGEVTDEGDAPVTERGICWSKNANPTLDDEDAEHIASGDGTGSFEIELTNLEVNTTYHVWAYATSVLGTRYGNKMDFTTKDGLPSVTTGDVTDITATSAKCSGNVTDDGGFAVTERGICWSKNANPTLDNAEHIVSGSGIGSFSVPLTGLEESTTYYMRAYAVNSNGTPFYGEDVSFTTLTPPLTFTANGVSFTMIPVEGGTFTMGATSEQGSDADIDEKPTHSVTLSSFYMGETEVTQALWQAVMGSNPSNFSGSNLPVERVSWNDCQQFVTKLNQLCASQLNGRQFALPTEAQWEYAARGGKKSQGYKYSGSNTVGAVAWYSDNSGSTTHAVGTKQANELGLYDMSGNVWEWCSDWYGSYDSSAQTDPTGPSTGSYRVVRGGSWDFSARYCRVSGRNHGAPDGTNFNLGFRLSLR